MLKLCRKYLNWIQNSVFEGEISEVRLKELLSSAKKFIDELRCRNGNLNIILTSDGLEERVYN